MSIRRFTLAMTVVVVVAVVASMAIVAAAGDGGYHTGDPWHNYWVDWHRNNCWPEPFVEPDAESVYTAFQVDIIKAWEQQNLLGDPHFEPNSYKMSPAGLIKLRWILTQNPPEFRTPFIERTASDEITARRLAAAQQAAHRSGAQYAGQRGRFRHANVHHSVGLRDGSARLVRQLHEDDSRSANSGFPEFRDPRNRQRTVINLQLPRCRVRLRACDL